jgi:hypothetical protein
MFRAGFSRALGVLSICGVLYLGSLGVVRLVQARSRPTLTADTKIASNEPSADDDRLGGGPSATPRTNAAAREDRAELRVLLVGNSYTLHHSLHLLLARVGAAVQGGPRLSVDAAARGGYSLRNHLRTGDALQRIRAGHYTHVVLQGHSLSAVDRPNELVADAQRFKQAIDAAASRTVFYATWARSPEVSLYRTHKLVHLSLIHI